MALGATIRDNTVLANYSRLKYITIFVQKIFHYDNIVDMRQKHIISGQCKCRLPTKPVTLDYSDPSRSAEEYSQTRLIRLKNTRRFCDEVGRVTN